MSDIYIPSERFGRFNEDLEAAEYQQFHELSNRLQHLTETAPYLANDPEVLTAIANMPVPIDRLQYLAGSVSAQMRLDGTRQDLERMEPGRARRIFNQLTRTQQEALRQSGYAPPSSDNGGSNPLLSAAGSGFGLVLGGVNTVITETPIVSNVFDYMIKLENGVKTLYRSIRTDDQAGLATFAAAAGGVLAAPFTGGLSLGVTAGVIGGSALAAGTATAFLTNPSDYIDALNDNWNGETVFSRSAQERARTLLQSSGLDVTARDIGWEMNAWETVKLFASTPDATSDQQFHASIGRVIDRIAEPGDPRREELYGKLVELIQIPEFREAVEVLQHSKVSFGRDIARLVGADPGTGTYNFLSGAMDGLFTIVLDPTLGAAGYVKWNRARRLGVPLKADDDMFDTINAIAAKANSTPQIGAAYDEIAHAVNTNQPHLLWRRVPVAKGMYDDLWNYKELVAEQGVRVRRVRQADGTVTKVESAWDGTFTRDDVFDWLSTGVDFERMLAGYGVKQGHGRLLLPTYGWRIPFTQDVLRVGKVFEGAKAAIDFADDAANRAHLRKVGRKLKAQGDQVNDVPMSTRVEHNLDGALRYSSSPDEEWRVLRATINALDYVPIANTVMRKTGQIMASFTEMMPATNSISMVGPQAAEGIQRMVGLGRVVGMDSISRKQWFDTIMQQDNMEHRINASISFLETMIRVGTASTEHADDLAAQFVSKLKQRYSLGNADQYLLGERTISRGIHPYQHTFDLPIPDLTEMRQLVDKGIALKYIHRVTDSDIADVAINKMWKPAVLLRVGFITRAAGEELLAHLMRVGPSSMLGEFGARAIAEGRVVSNLDTAALSSAQRAAVERMNYVAHVRPLERMFSSFEWMSPANDYLRRYSDFVRIMLERGLIPNLAEAIPESRRLALLGREGGLRHSLLTGVDPKLIEYMEAFTRKHASTVLREISSQNASVAAELRQGDFSMRFRDDQDELQQLNFVVERGEFRTYTAAGDAGDDLFDRTAHASVAKIVSDEVTGPIYAQVTSRWLHPNLTDDQAFAALNAYREVADWRVRSVFDELLTHTDSRTVNWESALEALSAKEPALADMLRASHRIVGDRPEDAAAVVATLRRWVRQRYSSGANLTDYGHVLMSQIDNMHATLRAFDMVGAKERAWLASFVDNWGQLDEMPELIHSFDEYRSQLHARLTDRHYDPEVQPLVDNLSYTNRLSDGTPVATPPKEGRTRLFVSQVTAEVYGKLLYELRTSGPQAVVGRLMSLWGDAVPHLDGLHLDRAEDMLRRFLTRLANDDPAVLARHAADVAAAGKHGDLIPLAHMGFDDPDIAQQFSQFLNGVLRPGGGELSVGGRIRANKGHVAILDLDDRIKQYTPMDIDGAKRPVAHQKWQDRITTRSLDEVPVETERVLHTWALDREYLTHRTVSMADRQIVDLPDGTRQFGADPREAISQGTEKMVQDWIEHIADTNQRRVVKGVAYKDAGATNQVKVGSEVRANEVLYDAKGTRLEYDDPDVFDVLDPDVNINHIHDNWTMLGPLLRDAADTHRGTARLVTDTRAYRTARGKRGGKIRADEAVRQAVQEPKLREFRGHWTHMKGLEHAPKVAIGPVLRPIEAPSRWERILEDAFEGIISPAIDAIVRRPMSAHFFAEAMRENERAKRWALSKHLFGDEATGEIGELAQRFGHLLDDSDMLLHQVDQTAEQILAATRVIAPDEYAVLAGLEPDQIVNAYFSKFPTDDISKGTLTQQIDAAERVMKADRRANIVDRLNEAGPRTRIKKDVRSVRELTYTDAADSEIIESAIDWVSTGNKPDGWTNVPDELKDSFARTFRNMREDADRFELLGGFSFGEWDEAIAAARQAAETPLWTVKVRQNPRPVEGILDAYEDILGEHLNKSWKEVQRHLDMLPAPLRNALDETTWGVLSPAYKSRARVQGLIEDLAAERAIRNAMPYLDSHEIRSQAGEYVRGFFPFMYAEENFLKRWARTIKVAPDALRKGQLVYMGLKSGGVIRTDSQGRDWYVYPGAGLVAETINRSTQMIGFGESMPSGLVFASETKNMLPGFDVERTGMPSANPLVAMPLGVMASMFHELRPIQEAFVGEVGVAQGGVKQFVPTAARRFWDIAGDEDSNVKYASAMMSAIAILEHNGHGLPEGATVNQLDDYIRRVRNHTRGILAAQAFVGFITPGSPSIQFTGESPFSKQNLAGLDVEIPADVFRKEYLDLIRELGIEEGTIAYFELNPDHDMHDLMAFTVGQSRSVSGAPVPVTHEAVKFADENQAFLEQYPMAGAWLLPQPDADNEDYDEYAYVQQSISGLRQKRSPTEFLEALKYREGSFDYFKSRERHEQMMREAEGDPQRRRQLNDIWGTYKARHLAMHPVFAEQLEGGEARQRRARVLDELRVAIEDPATPQVGHLAALADLVKSFDYYKITLAQLSDSRKAEDEERSERWKLNFENRVTEYLMDHPELEPLWLSVLRPEAGL